VRGIRTDEWKLIRYPHGDGGPDRWKAEVYNLKEDPLETKNLVDDPGVAAMVRQLRDEHERLKREAADPDLMPVDEGIKQTLPADAHRAVKRSGTERN
jgi:N-acetylglucosamine-6-sulfatase